MALSVSTSCFICAVNGLHCFDSKQATQANFFTVSLSEACCSPAPWMRWGRRRRRSSREKRIVPSVLMTTIFKIQANHVTITYNSRPPAVGNALLRYANTSKTETLAAWPTFSSYFQLHGKMTTCRYELIVVTDKALIFKFILSFRAPTLWVEV